MDVLKGNQRKCIWFSQWFVHNESEVKDAYVASQNHLKNDHRLNVNEIK